MDVVLHETVEEFAALARPLYEADPDAHTVALSVLTGMVRLGGPADVLMTVREGSVVTGALLCSPGRAPLVSGVAPEQAVAVVAALGGPARGAVGPLANAEAFAAAHVARYGGAVEVFMRERLFALGTLVPPVDVPGRARLVTAADLALVGEWRGAFAAELDMPSPETPFELAQRALALGEGQLLWEKGGAAVSFAAARVPAAGSSRVGPVYTPPEHRGHGYAAAVTAAATRWALDAGARRVLLFTDLANPTTNRLYPRLGYRPVHDALQLRFTE
jgi:GNAT superfamily N-acetyltransferase